VLIAIGIVSWVVIRKRGIGPRTPQHAVPSETQAPYQANVLDLRNRSVTRGREATPNNAPLELPRGRLALSIYLPIGLEPGEFEVEIVQKPGTPLRTASGSASLRDHIAVLEVKLDLTGLDTGLYLLAVRERAGPGITIR
jgi:hypothetical protein